MRRFGPALLVPGSLATIMSFMALRAAEISGAQRQFASRCGELTDLVQKEADAHLQVLAGVRAFFNNILSAITGATR
jgi:CHASE1-domain containing sensor protein